MRPSKRSTTWSYKENRSPLPVEAKAARNELRRIYKEREALTPLLVVEESKPLKAVLHPCFEWNNGKAAKAYRLYQARNVINVVQVTTVDDRGRKNTVPEFINVSSPTDDDSRARTYQPVEVAMDDPETRRNIIESCLRRLLLVRDNYRSLVEFARVWDAIDTLDAEFAKV